MTGHEWQPLGVRGTLRFLFAERGSRVASWRHFGWELKIETRGRWPHYVTLSKSEDS